MELIPHDLLHIIGTYMPFNEYLKLLTLAQLELPSNSEALAFQRIQHFFQLRNIKPEFFQALINSEAIISGSCLLQALLCENWDSDIDIYQYDSEYKASSNRAPYSPVENYLWLLSGESKARFSYNKYNHLLEKGITSVRKYVIDGITFQIINVRSLNGPLDSAKKKTTWLQEFISHDFDFPFCCNTYDGKKLWIKDYLSIRDKKGKSQIENEAYDFGFSHLSFEKTEITHTLIEHYRAMKYVKRGFHILNYQVPTNFYVYVNREHQVDKLQPGWMFVRDLRIQHPEISIQYVQKHGRTIKYMDSIIIR